MLIVYFIAAAIALVWGAVVVRQIGLLGGCLLLVVLAACFGHDFFHYSIGPLPLTSDRVALVLLAGSYVAARRLGWIGAPQIDSVDAFFGIFLLMLTANTVVHNWESKSEQPFARLLFLYIAPAVLYWLVRESVADQQHSRLLCGFLALLGIYLSATAIAEVKNQSALVFPSYILSSSNKEWLGRARGPFLNPVTNGLFLSASIFASTLFWPKANRAGKLLLAFGMCFALIGVYYTLTRSCWLGAVCGLGLIILAALPGRFRIPFALSGVLVLGLAIAIKGNHLSSFKRDKDVSEFHMAQSAELRPMLAYVAWKITLDYPLFGCGLGQYKKVDKNYLSDHSVDMPLERLKSFVQHNVFLSLLTETGFVGCGTFILLLLIWVRRAWRLWRMKSLPLAVRHFGLVFLAFITSWCINGMFHDMSLMVSSQILLFMLAGALQGFYVRADARSQVRTSRVALVAPARRNCSPAPNI